jgi:hypothetical protein
MARMSRFLVLNWEFARESLLLLLLLHPSASIYRCSSDASE